MKIIFFSIFVLLAAESVWAQTIGPLKQCDAVAQMKRIHGINQGNQRLGQLESRINQHLASKPMLMSPEMKQKWCLPLKGDVQMFVDLQKANVPEMQASYKATHALGLKECTNEMVQLSNNTIRNKAFEFYKAYETNCVN